MVPASLQCGSMPVIFAPTARKKISRSNEMQAVLEVRGQLSIFASSGFLLKDEKSRACKSWLYSAASFDMFVPRKNHPSELSCLDSFTQERLTILPGGIYR